MAPIRNLEWLNHNATRDYPLTNSAGATDVTGDFALPNDFLVAMYLSISIGSDVDPAKFAIKTVGTYATGFNLSLGYQSDTTFVTVGTAMIPRVGHETNTPYRINGVGDFVDTDGWVVVGNLGNIDEQPAGLWQFDYAGGQLELDVIRPQLRGVSALRVQNGAEVSDPIVGDVVLRAGRNARITTVLVSGEDPILVFDAIEGEGLNEECICTGDVTEAPAIRTINKIPPTAEGDFTLLGNDCAEFVAIDNGLQLNDTCAQPCCGCAELESVTSALEQFGRQAVTLENFLTNLEARVTSMDQAVLGSRLGDRGCNTCA